MKLKRAPKRWFAGMALIAFAPALAAATLAGVHLAPTLSVAGQALQLVSCGMRETLWIDHYAAGLYVPPGASAQVARDAKHPKAVRLKIIEARYLPEKIPEKWRGALNSELEREPMVRVRRAYGALREGDEVTFTYAPQEGVTMQVNGRAVMRASGHGVIDAILEAWAGEDPVSGKLSRLSLEHPC